MGEYQALVLFDSEWNEKRRFTVGGEVDGVRINRIYARDTRSADIHLETGTYATFCGENIAFIYYPLSWDNKTYKEFV